MKASAARIPILWANNEDNDFVLEHPDARSSHCGYRDRTKDISAAPHGGAANGSRNEGKLAGRRCPYPAIPVAFFPVDPLSRADAGKQLESTAYDQTTEHMQIVNGIVKEVAEETNAGYFDTLQLFTRAHAEAGWMEQLLTPQYGDGNVHPGNPLNLVLARRTRQGAVHYAPEAAG